MNGLEAISAHNGWAMAVVGISIVFTGLTLLSIAIAQLHKILDLWDNRTVHFQRLKERKKLKTPAPDILSLPEHSKDAVRQVKMLAEWIGEPFPLPKLLEFSERRGLPSPYSTINDLLQASIIVPDGEGYFRWNK